MQLSNNLSLYGIILIFLGIILIILSSLTQVKTNVKTGGIIFVGSFPLLWYASDKQMFYILITLTILAITIFYLLKR